MTFNLLFLMQFLDDMISEGTFERDYGTYQTKIMTSMSGKKEKKRIWHKGLFDHISIKCDGIA